MRNLVLSKGGSLMFFSVLVWSISVMSMVENFVLLWILLEVNMLSFIPLMKSGGVYKVNSAMMKYFLVQSLGSFFILYSVMSVKEGVFSLLVVLGLLIKLGNPPSFIWLPSVMKSLEWYPVSLLATLQKIPPLMIFSGVVSSLGMVMFFCGLGFIVSGLGGLMQSHLMSLMAYSSMAHMSWVMLGMAMSTFVGWVYLVIYMFSVMILFNLLNKMSWYKMSELGGGGVSMYLSLMLTMSLAGMPPFMGFFSKLMVFQLLGGMSFIIILTILMSIGLNLFFYSNLSFLMFSGKDRLVGSHYYGGGVLMIFMFLMLVVGGLFFF